MASSPDLDTATRSPATASPTLPPARDYAAPALALTFLFTGISYALPMHLFPPDHPYTMMMGWEVVNMYCIVAWMGLAHFVYAYWGQGKAIFRRRSLALPFSGILLGAAVLLYGLRSVLPGLLFHFLVWAYFIPHYVKAEVHFTRMLEKDATFTGWVVYWFPALAFAYLTYAIFGIRAYPEQSGLLIPLALGCVVAGFLGGVHKQLQDKYFSHYALLAFFFIGEGLVWGQYSKHMHPFFQYGLYTFHVAIASFYHYFRAYGFAHELGWAQPNGRRFIPGVSAVNLCVILLGMATFHIQGESFLAWIFDIRYFTFWVGLHLLASDGFYWLKQRGV